MYTTKINFGAIGDGRGFESAVELHDFLFKLCQKHSDIFFRFSSEKNTSMDIETHGSAVSTSKKKLQAFKSDIEDV